MSLIDLLFPRKYQVKLRGRSEIEYIEGNKRITVAAEMMSGDVDLLLYTSSLAKWDKPFQNVKITDEDKKRIIENISTDLKRHKIYAEWVS